METLVNWFNKYIIGNENKEQAENVKILNKKVKDLYKPSVLVQGQRLHNNQAATVDNLTPNLLAFNESITPPYTNRSPFVNTNTYASYNNTNTYANGNRYSIANTYATTNTYIKNTNPGNCMEGFGDIQTTAKNNNELADTTSVSATYAQKIGRYNTEYPSLLNDARTYTQGTDRTKNFKDSTNTLDRNVYAKYNITADKEGCYKQTAGSDLTYQADISEVTLEKCKMRASDLAYSGFSINKKSDGQLACYLTNDVEGNKTAGISTKPQTSLNFKTNKNANMGGLLMNGQLGIFQDKPDNAPLATDLTAVPGCDNQTGEVLINANSITATFGANCNK